MIPSPAHASLLPTLRQLLQSTANERLHWMRANLATTIERSGQDAMAIQALTGVSAGTVRGFLRHTDSSVGNVILMALALGISLADLERPPEEFARLIESRDG